jgi:hypothetical protein
MSSCRLRRCTGPRKYNPCEEGEADTGRKSAESPELSFPSSVLFPSSFNAQQQQRPDSNSRAPCSSRLFSIPNVTKHLTKHAKSRQGWGTPLCTKSNAQKNVHSSYISRAPALTFQANVRDSRAVQLHILIYS